MHIHREVSENVNQQPALGMLLNRQKPKSIADDIFNNLKSNGLADKDIVAVSSEILSRLTEDIKRRNG